MHAIEEPFAKEGEKLCRLHLLFRDRSYAGERLIGELAPELVPMLASLQQPANFVPLTNAVLKEVARRGVNAEKLNSVLQKMGSEIPLASKGFVEWAKQQSIDVRIISDCNTHFIGQMLEGELIIPVKLFHDLETRPQSN